MIISNGMNYVLIIKGNEFVSRLNGLRIKLAKSGCNRREAYDMPDYLLGHSLSGTFRWFCCLTVVSSTNICPGHPYLRKDFRELPLDTGVHNVMVCYGHDGEVMPIRSHVEIESLIRE